MTSASDGVQRLFLYDNSGSCRDPYRNIAIEEYLMRHVPEDAVTLYLWQNEKTVVIGRNQDAFGECRVEALEADGGHLARRLSGGGAVYHNVGNLNFTFCAPKPLYDVARQVSVIAAAAASFGIHAEKTGRNDIMADGRKFSGNAFYRSGERCYHHGTILIAEDMRHMVRYLDTAGSKLHTKSVKSVPARVVNLADLNPAVTVPAFRRAMRQAFCEVYGLPVTVLGEADLDWEAIREREAFFASEDWRFGCGRHQGCRREGHFPWGTLRLWLAVDQGIVTEAAVDSDGLAAEVIAAIPEALRGAPAAAEALAARLDTIKREGMLEEEVLRDTAALIRKALPADKPSNN